MDGKYYEVRGINHDENILYLKDEQGHTKDFTLHKHSTRKLEVFLPRTLEVRVGDCLTWTKSVNIDEQKRSQDQRVLVSEISNDSVTVTHQRTGTKFVINDSNYMGRHVDYGYAKMLFKAGSGVQKYDGVLINRDIEASELVDITDVLSEHGILLIDRKSRIEQQHIEFTPIELEKYQLSMEQAIAKDIVYTVLTRSNERNAVQTRHDLLNECINRSVDIPKDCFNEAIESYINKGELQYLEKDDLVATKYVLDHEKLAVDLMVEGQDSIEPIMAKDHPMLQQILSDPQLTDGQRQAIERILTTQDSVLLIQGLAGSGKTYMMKKVLEGANSVDVHVVGLGVTASKEKANSIKY